MNALQDPEDLDEASRLINQYAASDWVTISYGTHARERLHQRVIPQGVVELALKSGTVVSFRVLLTPRLTYRYKVRFLDAYGAVNVVTVIAGLHKLHIVTVFPDDSDNDQW